jgi:predicted ATPase
MLSRGGRAATSGFRRQRPLSHQATPELRPSGGEILAALGGRAPVEIGGERNEPSAPIVAPAGTFVGREPNLNELEHALDTVSKGRTLLMIVCGPSGIGKTMLARKFLETLEQSERALVLAGRCYERESVPFKALDPIVDALCHRLMLMDAETLDAVLPKDASAIARLFPVLDRVEQIGGAPDRTIARDPVELLRRAVRSLRSLIASLAKLRPVVLFIDDLQWGDADSAALLSALLEPPSPPPLLLITSHRSEDDDAPILQRLRSIDVEVRRLVLGALDEEESSALAFELLEGAQGSTTVKEHARSIAKESGGNPFFISARKKGLTFDAISLDEVLDGRLDRLAPVARRLMEVLAVAGRPIKQSVANLAAGLGQEDREPLDALRHQHLVRTRGSRPDDLVETFHDRIRERAQALLDPEELARTHLALAEALVALDPSDAEGLAARALAASISSTPTICSRRRRSISTKAMARRWSGVSTRGGASSSARCCFVCNRSG